MRFQKSFGNDDDDERFFWRQKSARCQAKNERHEHQQDEKIDQEIRARSAIAQSQVNARYVIDAFDLQVPHEQPDCFFGAKILLDTAFFEDRITHCKLLCYRCVYSGTIRANVRCPRLT